MLRPLGVCIQHVVTSIAFTHIFVAVFSTFNYADAVGTDDSKRRQNAAKVEKIKTKWFDGRARVGYSKDGIPIVYHIPGAISNPVRVSLSPQTSVQCLTHPNRQDHTFKTFMEMGKLVKLELGGGADGSRRNAKASYRIRKGELSGIIKLVMLWHAIGHPVGHHFCTFFQLSHYDGQ